MHTSTLKLPHHNWINCLGTPEEDNQQPSLGSNTSEGSTTNDRILSTNVEDSNIDTNIQHLEIDDDIVWTAAIT